MMTADGAIRPHWHGFVQDLDGLPADTLAKGLRKAERLLHENGLAYTLAASTAAPDRPWGLDFVPLVLPADEWRTVEQGLIQRARLLNGVLADLYGPQRLLAEGHLPAALVLANPHFLRPCHGIQPRDGVYLQHYAADLGRGPDGRWTVLADRTQAPAGMGYALENRIVLSQSLPELFRHRHIQRLAVFFQSMHNTLMARTGREDPRIVLLTQGPDRGAYFDVAYQARYLGYILAEDIDLTVRNNRVYLKTVDGLKPVDLILRGVESEHCDPLELDAAAGRGIAGLVRAVAEGSVAVANALGSGLVETKALMGFLPQLCRVLLDEDLAIPSTPTWWCGRDDDARHVLDHLDRLVIERAYERRPLLADSTGPAIGGELAAGQAEEIRRKVQHAGHDYVAQALMTLSTTPVWADGAMQPRPMSVRVFLAATEDGYQVMPGGLCRVSDSDDPRAAMLRRGTGAKDTWVLSDEPVSGFSLLRLRSGVLEPRRKSKDIPSHSADNLFWLGRYAERAEDTMRVLRSVLRRLTEEIADAGDVTAMDAAVGVLMQRTGLDEASAEERQAGPTTALERQVRSLLYGKAVPYGLLDTLENLSRTATQARDWLSVEAWHTLQRLYLDATDGPSGLVLDVGGALERMDDGIRVLAAFAGLEMENMTRDYGWRFLDMGRRLERAVHLAGIMQGLLVRDDPEDNGGLTMLLQIADSTMTYRWRYLTTPMVAPVIDLLLLDESNPRSIAFQIAALEAHVDNLPRDLQPPARSEEQRIMIALLTALRLAEVPSLCAQDAAKKRPALSHLLEQVAEALPKLSEAITRTYFSHAEARRPADLMKG